MCTYFYRLTQYSFHTWVGKNSNICWCKQKMYTIFDWSFLKCKSYPSLLLYYLYKKYIWQAKGDKTVSLLCIHTLFSSSRFLYAKCQFAWKTYVFTHSFFTHMIVSVVVNRKLFSCSCHWQSARLTIHIRQEHNCFRKVHYDDSKWGSQRVCVIEMLSKRNRLIYHLQDYRKF